MKRAIAFPTVSASSATSSAPPQGLVTGSGPWLAAGTGPQWVIWDFGTPSRMTALTLTFPSSGCWSFVVDASEGGSPTQPGDWTTLMNQTGSTCATSYALSGDVSYRYVRVTITGGGPIGLQSLQFAASVAEPPATRTQARTARMLDAPAVSTPEVVMESCDLWSSVANWQSVLAYAPANRPLGGPYEGLYDDTYPATTTARIDLALQAGITAFQGCWYRQGGNAGQPVQTSLNGVVRALADTSPARADMRWSIFWDNGNGIDGGVSGLDDFVRNLVPFWITSYFTRPNYLTIDGKPVITIADAGRLASQLGGIDAAAAAIDALRAEVVAAGLPGIVILGCNNASSHASNATAAAIGFDAIMAYSTPVGTGLLTTANPPGDVVVAAEEQSWTDWAAYSTLPTTLTVSMGYDATIWAEGAPKFLVSPVQLGELMRDALGEAAAAPATDLRHRLIFIDNWNEYGEGRFIEPSLAYGGSYLNALSAVLCPACGFSYSPATGLLSSGE